MKKKSLYWQIPLLLLLIAGTCYIALKEHADASKETGFLHNEGFMFGTVYNITYQSDHDLHGEVERALAKVDMEFSMFNERSTVSAINRGEDPERSPIFQEVYDLAMRVSDDTNGAFDISVAPLVNARGFGFKHEQMPTPEQVDSLLLIRSQLDFSAIAKGYGCDIAARTLEENGVANYMVEIGGEVVTRGHNAKGEPWRIGITKPTDDGQQRTAQDSVIQTKGAHHPGGELQAILSVNESAMATSGNYRNFYYKGGRKYAHTIDPRTGYPVQHELLSATVFAANCATADAYATAFMVLGLKDSQELLARHPELKAYFIYTDEKGELAVWHSPELAISD